MKKKIDNFFGLWSCIMAAGGPRENGDDDPLGQLLDRIFQEECKDGREAMEWFKEELGKVKHSGLKKDLKDAVEDLVNQSKYFHFAAGFALGGLYDVMDPKARAQIEYLKKRIHDGRVFPMTAKVKEPEPRELCAPAPEADALEKGQEEKEKAA